ncbi:YtfJ family protein [Sulfurimonas sp.]
MKLKAVVLSTLVTVSLSALTVGEIPKTVTLSKDNGGLAVDGSPWSSASIKDKVYVMFYVDPDEKDVNSHFSDALKAKKYDRTKYGSLAVVNLAATWKPNFVIEKILKSKQKEFPDTIYVKDKNSVLVNEWEVADDSSDIIIFNKDGNVLFYKAGKMSDEDMQKAFSLIEANI